MNSRIDITEAGIIVNSRWILNVDGSYFDKIRMRKTTGGVYMVGMGCLVKLTGPVK